MNETVIMPFVVSRETLDSFHEDRTIVSVTRQTARTTKIHTLYSVMFADIYSFVNIYAFVNVYPFVSQRTVSPLVMCYIDSFGNLNSMRIPGGV